MRRVLVSAAAPALVLVSAASAEAAPSAALRIVDRDPLTFKGLHFKAGERVRLVEFTVAALHCVQSPRA